MTMLLHATELKSALDTSTSRLLAARNAGGHWVGELSASALSTATAIIALTLASQTGSNAKFEDLANNGIHWLLRNQNEDGGWGDTILSISNISTTALCWAALTLSEAKTEQTIESLSRVEGWLRTKVGTLDRDALTEAIKRRYGKDRTFSVPILTVLAIGGLLGEGKEGWGRVPQLPFELAAFPQDWYGRLRLPVVSYALPALIAIGQARHHQRPTRILPARWLRNRLAETTLRKLGQIQPQGGGFLEATPLTSFVVMSLIAAGRADHAVVGQGLDFLVRSTRPDGSWPIDTNLATWVTTLSINALANHPEWPSRLNQTERDTLRAWLLNQQYRERHPYTGAAPGAWAWTNLPGGVPDADDTPGALLALKALGGRDKETAEAAAAGVRWLLDLQNSDGGVPTFCPGWGALPFDRSSPDLTAHALRAWQAWRDALPPDLARRVAHAIPRAVDYLVRSQRSDGAWQPLWFGNQHAPEDVNLTYGTARVLEGLCALPESATSLAAETRARQWIEKCQNDDGGWGGAPGVRSSIEETALAVSALATICRTRRLMTTDTSIHRGVDWLLAATNGGRVYDPSPIGFYFAKLWYFKILYPLIFSVEAFSLAARLRDPEGAARDM
jgi:squalene-hopene/tetraprenyl-beta-curcumene cyclase